MSESNIVNEQRLEVLSIGETLIDLISDTGQGSLDEARSFHMYPDRARIVPCGVLGI